ncbi:MAG: glutathione peroxidase [Bacteroidetes bacterium]|nr:glutathione peroxidase [Bacteroidota bacterium]
MSTEFYALWVNTPQGREVSLADYKGKTLLIVNTATKCGFAPQFEGLEDLYQRYKGAGLVVLGFPCNQFSAQEPEPNETMEAVCKLNFGVNFPLFEKVLVNGADAHPLFKFLKSKLGGWFGSRVKWNFTKFLVSAEGKPLKRWGPMTKPEAIEPYIKKVLG